MSLKENERRPRQKIIDDITDRASYFTRESKRIEKERAGKVKKDLKLFEELHNGPCTIKFPDQAPLVIAKGEVWGTGVSKQEYLRRLPPSGSLLKKLNDRQLIGFWEKIVDTKLEIEAGVQVEGFILPPKPKRK